MYSPRTIEETKLLPTPIMFRSKMSDLLYPRWFCPEGWSTSDCENSAYRLRNPSEMNKKPEKFNSHTEAKLPDDSPPPMIRSIYIAARQKTSTNGIFFKWFESRSDMAG